MFSAETLMEETEPEVTDKHESKVQNISIFIAIMELSDSQDFDEKIIYKSFLLIPSLPR